VKKSTQTIKKRTRRKPTARPSLLADSQPINPNFFYRKAEGWKFFGYKTTQLDEKIKSGLIPAPIILDGSIDGRARGWFGSTIIQWQTDLIAAQQKSA
jgi:predicted DNA-binding transcriptional regulator AlpA